MKSDPFVPSWLNEDPNVADRKRHELEDRELERTGFDADDERRYQHAPSEDRPVFPCKACGALNPSAGFCCESCESDWVESLEELADREGWWLNAR